MTWDEYIEQVTSDAEDVISWGEYDDCKDLEEVEERLFVDDAVTGHGSGSYYCNSYKASQAVAELVFDDDFTSELRGIGYDLGEAVEQGPEALDVIARCLALPYCLDAIRAAWEARREEIEA